MGAKSGSLVISIIGAVGGAKLTAKLDSQSCSVVVAIVWAELESKLIPIVVIQLLAIGCAIARSFVVTIVDTFAGAKCSAKLYSQHRSVVGPIICTQFSTQS